MDIILVGAGKVGFTLAQFLTKEGHSVTVIDRDPARIALVNTELDVMTVCGAVDLDLLRLAGAEAAELLIAATDSDESNILCCMVARKLGVAHTIARVRQAEHFREVVLLREELGLSLTVNPEQAAALEISRVLRFPSAARVDTIAKGQAELVEFRLSRDNPLVGTELKSWHARYGGGTLVCAVRRAGEVLIPGGDFVLKEGDAVTVVGAPSDVHALFKSLNIHKKGARYVLLVGGSRVAYYLAQQLLSMGLRVKLIEKDPAKADRLKDRLPKAEIAVCDGSRPDVLDEEGMPAFDALAALTGSDEVNLVVSAYARQAGIPKVVAKVDEPHYAPLASAFGLDTPVRPRELVAAQVLRYVRAMENSAGVSGVESLLRVQDGRLEVLEFRASESSPCVGRTLMDLPIREGVLIAAVIREGACLIPRGGDELRPGDSVLAVTNREGMTCLEDILR